MDTILFLLLSTLSAPSQLPATPSLLGLTSNGDCYYDHARYSHGAEITTPAGTLRCRDGEWVAAGPSPLRID